MYGIIARPGRAPLPRARRARRTSVVIPCRNEAGHIPSLVARLPDLGPGSEFLFVEGNSTDDTEAVLRRRRSPRTRTRRFRFLKQPGKGKGDAVRARLRARRRATWC